MVKVDKINVISIDFERNIVVGRNQKGTRVVHVVEDEKLCGVMPGSCISITINDGPVEYRFS